MGRVRWYRIILDEGKWSRKSAVFTVDEYANISTAHIIRNWSTKQFGAVLGISAHTRWCVTGTPIQNRLEDLGALVRFLRLPILEEPSVFRQYVCSELQTDGQLSEAEFPNLRLLLGSICLRRAQTILHFRFTSVYIRPKFGDDEEKDYRTLEMRCREALTQATASKNAVASHSNVLEKLLRLREFCNGISPLTGTSPDAIFSLMQQEGEVRCEYCTTDIATLDSCENDGQIKITECRRVVCSDLDCSTQYWSDLSSAGGAGSSVCPFCKIRHRTNDILAGPTKVDTVEAPKRFPTKLMELLKDVKMHMAKHKW